MRSRSLLVDPSINRVVTSKETLDPWVSKRKVVRICKNCGHFKFRQCSIGYFTRETSTACRQAITREEKGRAY